MSTFAWSARTRVLGGLASLLAFLVVAVVAAGAALDLRWVSARRAIPWLPDWPDSHAVPAMIAIATAMAGAPLVYRTGRGMLRPFLLLGVLTASILVAAKLPVVLVQNPGGLRVTVQIASILVLAYLFGKLALLHRFSTFHGTQVSWPPGELDKLLPFQHEDLQRLRQAVLVGRVDDGARVVQLVGRWGEGKSFLLKRFGTYLEHRQNEEPKSGHDCCAVVLIDVWEQQSEPDLHLAIVEQILGHKQYWFPYGWLRYPLSLYLGWLTKQVKLAVSTGTKMDVKVELPISLPRLTGKRTLERLVARVRNRGCRTVVVLDEIDRAAPPIAQASVTFAVRSLNLPGVIVVLAYVEEILRYKAFNPLVDCLPDLGSTMRAVIFASGPDQGVPGAPGGGLSEVGDSSLARWKAWEDASTIALSGSAPSTPATTEDGQRSLTDQNSRRLSDAVRLGFAYADRARRQRLQARAAEKYLGSRPINLHHLRAIDIAFMVVNFETLSYLVDELVGENIRQPASPAGSPADRGNPIRNRVVRAIEDSFQFYQEVVTDPLEMPPLRAFEGELFRRLSGVDLKNSTLTRVSPQFVAAVVLAAFDAATLQNL